MLRYTYIACLLTQCCSDKYGDFCEYVCVYIYIYIYIYIYGERERERERDGTGMFSTNVVKKDA